MLLRGWRRLGQTSGFTLVEVLLVIVITATMTVVTMELVTSMFSANLRAGQQLGQQSSAEQFSGFMVARLALTQRPVGVLKDSSHIDPLSLAGDQVVFQYEKTCARVFYLERKNQIRAVVAPRLGADDCIDALEIKRGPNEQLNNGNYTLSSTDTGNALYDPGLDANSGSHSSFLLVDRVIKDRPVSAPAGAPAALRPFSFLSESSQPGVWSSFIAGPHARASSTAAADGWYGTASNREAIRSVTITAYLSGGQEGSSVRDAAQSRYFSQNITVQQIVDKDEDGNADCSFDRDDDDDDDNSCGNYDDDHDDDDGYDADGDGSDREGTLDNSDVDGDGHTDCPNDSDEDDDDDGHCGDLDDDHDDDDGYDSDGDGDDDDD